ncbi:hypothetical protein IAU59_000945 [Kwoniella sp. CBS 9459]
MVENKFDDNALDDKNVSDSRSPILASSSSQDSIDPHTNLLGGLDLLTRTADVRTGSAYSSGCASGSAVPADSKEARCLLYDLAVVAVLTIFSNNHELNRPSAIPIFLSYYAIISWVWTSQMHYDIRYQARDGWHRIAKAVQTMMFVYMGAASGNWNPALIKDQESYLADMSSMDAL